MINSPEQLASVLKARLQTITTANGYETDLGLHVAVGRVSVSEDDALPRCTLIEDGDTVEDAQGLRQSAYLVTRRYLLVGYIECDPDEPNTIAHAAIRDFKKAVFRVDGRYDGNLGGEVKLVRYRGSDMAPRADGSKLMIVGVEIAVSYVEDLSNPT